MDGPVYHLRLEEFVLERLDPLHRPGRGLGIIWDYYNAMECYAYPLDLPAGTVLPEYAHLGTRTFKPSEYYFTWLDNFSAAGWIWTSVLMRHAYSFYWYNNVAKGNTNWQPGAKEWDELQNVLKT